MSSIFSSITNNNQNKPRHKRRSESVSGLERVKERRRDPIVKFNSTDDVATAICVEVSRAILTNPDLNLGVFTKTSTEARTEIIMSDATLLVSAAVLYHIGNTKGASKLLSRSATISKYFKEMGLDDVKIRSMYVTVLFALNPEFVAMIEKSVRTCIDRSEAEGKIIHTEARVSNALITLEQAGTMDRSELVRQTIIDVDAPRFYRESSIQKTPTDMVAPSDSVSQKGSPPRQRYRLTEKELLEYVKRRKSGMEPEFGDIFRHVEKPITVNKRRNREGLGFNEETAEIRDPWATVNNILGSQRVNKYDMRTGLNYTREPRVEDFINSEEISDSVLEAPPDEDSTVTIKYNKDNHGYYAPTDSYLPSSFAAETETTLETPKRKGSLEMLLASFERNANIN